MNHWVARILASVAYGLIFYCASVIVLSADPGGRGWQTESLSWELPLWVGFITVLPAVLLIAFAIFAALDVYVRPLVGVQVVCLLLSGWVSFLAVIAFLITFEPAPRWGSVGAYHSPHGAGGWLWPTVAIPVFLYLCHALFARRRRDRLDRSRARSWLIHWYWGAVPTAMFAGFALYLRWSYLR